MGSKEVKNFWIRTSSSFMGFCMEHIVKDNQRKIEKGDLRNIYANYCKKYSLRSESDKVIKRVLEEMFGVSEERPAEFSYSPVWAGIKYQNIDSIG